MVSVFSQTFVIFKSTQNARTFSRHLRSLFTPACRSNQGLDEGEMLHFPADWTKTYASELKFKLVDMSETMARAVLEARVTAAIHLRREHERDCVCVWQRVKHVYLGIRLWQGCCLLPLYVIFMDLTSRCSPGLESVQFGDIRVPPLLFFNDVVHEASTDCRCSLWHV